MRVVRTIRATSALRHAMRWTDAMSTARVPHTDTKQAVLSCAWMRVTCRYSKHTLMGCVLQSTGLRFSLWPPFPKMRPIRFWQWQCRRKRFVQNVSIFVNEMNVKICKTKQMLGKLLNTAVYPMFNPVS